MLEHNSSELYLKIRKVCSGLSFTDRTSIYNSQQRNIPSGHGVRPTLSVGRTLRVRVFDFTQSAHFAVVHNLWTAPVHSCARSSHVPWLLLPTGCTHAPFSPDAQLRSQRASRISPASSSTLDSLFALSAHRLASGAKSRHYRSGLLELHIFFDMRRALVRRSFLTGTLHGAHIKQATNAWCCALALFSQTFLRRSSSEPVSALFEHSITHFSLYLSLHLMHPINQELLL